MRLIDLEAGLAGIGVMLVALLLGSEAGLAIESRRVIDTGPRATWISKVHRVGEPGAWRVFGSSSECGYRSLVVWKRLFPGNGKRGKRA